MAELHSSTERLRWEVRELSLGTNGEIERIQGPPTPLRFLRDFVLPNKPCIITNAIDHWPALVAWTNSYLRAALADQFVSVHSTPNGFADAVVDLDCLDWALHPVSCSRLETGHTCRDSSAGLPDDGSCKVNATVNCGLPKELCDDAHLTASRLDEEEDASRPKAAGEGHLVLHTGKNSLTNKSMVISTSTTSSNATAHSAMISSGSSEQVSYGGDTTSITSDGRTALQYEQHAASAHGQTCVSDLSAFPPHDQKPSLADETVVCKDACSLKMDFFCKAGCDTCGKEENLNQAWFVMAHVDHVPFSTALDMILHSDIGSGVAYAQEQNGCFLSEYSTLSADAETHLSWATEAFGCFPEAVNLWIGNEKAVTSFHKDHYENLYAVIAGEKHFTLLPPTDVHRLYIQEYPSAHYVKQEGRFAIEQEKPVKLVPWASVNPYPPAESVSVAKARFPEYFDGPKPFTCTLRAGEILYLPSLWFHHVRQTPDLEGRTIALNFWYDMQFDIKYAYYNFLESLVLKS